MVLGASEKNEIAKAAITILKIEETRDILNLLFAKLMNGTHFRSTINVGLCKSLLSNVSN